jgi:uncharacterized protein (TIGR02284 family)
MAEEDKDLNRDPLTDEPGAHPVGTGIGAAGGAVAGAAAGTIGGPIGSMVGGVIGAVVGGLAGKAAAEAVNPTVEEAHWRENYTREPYYEQGRTFEDYGPAYRHGVSGRMRHETDWDAAEPHLASEWENARVSSNLSWDQARPATRAAWDRVERQRAAGAAMVSDTEVVRADALAGTGAMAGGTDMVGSSVGTSSNGFGEPAGGGVAGAVGRAQSAGNMSGDRKDVIDALQDLVECCKDGEYGFRESAEQAKRADIKSVLLQRADDCRLGAEQLNQEIRRLGGTSEDSGSALGMVHRGWVAVRATLSRYDDHAVLEECERGEDNAMARYRKALKQPLPDDVRQVVERQFQGVQRNHDQIRALRDSTQST